MTGGLSALFYGLCPCKTGMIPSILLYVVYFASHKSFKFGTDETDNSDKQCAGGNRAIQSGRQDR
jgi:hypothetical protein